MLIIVQTDTLYAILNDLGEANMPLFGILTPHRIVDHISEITPEFLLKAGMDTILLDLDNTLTHWNSYEVEAETFSWVEDVKKAGLRLCIVSNNKRRRIEIVAQLLEVPYIYKAGKPMKKAFLKALSIMNALPQKTIFIGDQLFTDVLGANRVKLYTVLVKPLHPREFIVTRFVRRFEKIVMHRIVPKE